MRWLVPAVCAVAAVLALLTGSPAGVDHAEGRPSPDPGQTVASPASTGPPGELAEMHGSATEVIELPEAQARELLTSCLAVDPEADPSLGPDPGRVEVVASGEADGTAAIVWVGPTPQYGAALGSCVAVRQGSRWQLVGRATRRDLGGETPSLAWHPAASDRGAAAVLGGRLEEGATTLLVVLEQGRVLRQQVTAGVAAVAWQPVEQPLRIVVLGPEDEVRYDGPLPGYAS